MMKIFLVFYAVIGFLKFLGTVACRIFREKPKADTSSAPPSLDWYGVCDKCGNKAGLHKLN